MKHILKVGLVCGVLVATGHTPASPDRDHTMISIEIMVSEEHVSPGDTFSIHITLNPPITMRWIDLKISYDSDLVVSILQPEPRSSSDVRQAKMNADTKKGALVYRASPCSRGSVSDGRSSLCSFTFLAVKPGRANFEWRRFGATLEKISGPGAPFRLTSANIIISESKETTIDRTLPDRFDLTQNFPNPFNPETRISYQLPIPGHVRLTVFNILGQEVRTLVDAQQPAGYYTIHWDGKDKGGCEASSGTYFCRIEAEGFSKVRRMTLLR